MIDDDKPKYAKFKDMSLEEFFEKLPKPTLRMKLYMFGEKIRNIFWGSPKKYKDYGGATRNQRTERNSSSSTKTFKESQHFDPEKVYIQREQEEAYLKSAGFKREELILTPEERMKRKQEDAYLESLPGYRKKDNERDDR